MLSFVWWLGMMLNVRNASTGVFALVCESVFLLILRYGLVLNDLCVFILCCLQPSVNGLLVSVKTETSPFQFSFSSLFVILISEMIGAARSQWTGRSDGAMVSAEQTVLVALCSQIWPISFLQPVGLHQLLLYVSFHLCTVHASQLCVSSDF